MAEAVTVWNLVPSFVRGLRRGWRRIKRRSALLLAPAAGITIVLTLLIGNVGTIVRERLQLVVLPLAFIGLGWDRIVREPEPEEDEAEATEAPAVLVSSSALSPSTTNRRDACDTKSAVVLVLCVALAATGASVFLATRKPGAEAGARRSEGPGRPPAGAKVVKVPGSIKADCSRAVEDQIMQFLASVPEGSIARFAKNGCNGQDRTIVLRDRRRLFVDGNGSTFRRITPPNPYDPVVPNSNAASWLILRGDTVTLENLTIAGNYQPTPRGSAANQGQYTDHGMSIWGGSNVTLYEVAISNTDGELIAVDPDVEVAREQKGGDYSQVAPSRNVVVERLRGEHAARQCIATTAVDGFLMKDSSIGDCQQAGFDGEVDVGGELNRNIRLINNMFSGTYFAAVQFPVPSLPGFEGSVGNIELRGNTMTTATDTCFPSILIGDARGSIEGVVIAENVLLTIGDGIRFEGTVKGEVTANDIRKTVVNTGCYNPKNDPPYATPVRLNASPLAVSRNTAKGFCCGQGVRP